MPSETQVCRFTVHKYQGIGSTPQAALKDLIRQTQNLTYVRTGFKDLSGVDFRGCNLKHTEFYTCDLTECNFQGCDLTEVFFSNCTFDYTNFRGATLHQPRREYLERNWPSALLGPAIDGNQLLLEF